MPMVIREKRNRTARLQQADFSSLMLVYELLYCKLDRLLDRQMAEGLWCSRLPGHPPLYLQRVENHTYVTVDHLSHHFPADCRNGQMEPDAFIKRYHDLRLAELMACTPDRHVNQLSHPLTASGKALRERWRMNRFLLKWCDHLLDQGHGPQTFRLLDAAEWNG